MISGLHSADIAVPSVENALKLYRDALGLEQLGTIEPSQRGYGVRWVELGVRGKPLIALLEPVGPGPVQRFLDRRGNGLYQICFDCRDLEAAAHTLEAHGVPTTRSPQSVSTGASRLNVPESLFIHPKYTSGVLIEIMKNGE